MDNYQKQLDLFLIELFDLTDSREEVEYFIKLYKRTFDREPTDEVIDQYKAKISYEEDSNSYSY